MKIRLIFFCLLAIAGLSCNKENFNYAKNTVGSSKIIYFPIISTKGDKIIAVKQGDVYADAGATATLNNAPVDYIADQTINTANPGIYTITYTASNPQGFTASDWRMVVVIPSSVVADPVVSANDFSGVYLRAATGVTSTWVKLGTGVYKVENPGGSSGVGKYVVVTNYSGNDISIPTQNAPDFGGTVSSGNETYSPGPPATYSWKFFAIGYGTGLRSFVKQ